MFCSIQEAIRRPYRGGGGSHVAHLNFKTSCVGVYKCLSLIVGSAVSVAIWPREVVSCRDFILCAVTSFWAMSRIGLYPGRASIGALILSHLCYVSTNSQLIMMYRYVALCYLSNVYNSYRCLGMEWRHAFIWE